ncbi:MAG: hypothetical protein ACLR0A_11115 [Faecalibacillus intestinalis]|jgi:hypothetical protein
MNSKRYWKKFEKKLYKLYPCKIYFMYDEDNLCIEGEKIKESINFLLQVLENIPSTKFKKAELYIRIHYFKKWFVVRINFREISSYGICFKLKELETCIRSKGDIVNISKNGFQVLIKICKKMF